MPIAITVAPVIWLHAVFSLSTRPPSFADAIDADLGEGPDRGRGRLGRLRVDRAVDDLGQPRGESGCRGKSHPKATSSGSVILTAVQ
jgi:hypothetical protein